MRLGVAVAPGYVARRMRRAVGLADAEGLLVRAVDEGSPAARAGVRPGDLITRLGGQPIVEIESVYGVIDGIESGSEVELRVLRGADEIVLAMVPDRR